LSNESIDKKVIYYGWAMTKTADGKPDFSHTTSLKEIQCWDKEIHQESYKVIYEKNIPTMMHTYNKKDKLTHIHYFDNFGVLSKYIELNSSQEITCKVEYKQLNSANKYSTESTTICDNGTKIIRTYNEENNKEYTNKILIFKNKKRIYKQTSKQIECKEYDENDILIDTYTCYSYYETKPIDPADFPSVPVVLQCKETPKNELKQLNFEIKYYLWAAIGEGSGALLVDYNYKSLEELKINMEECHWKMDYYKVIYSNKTPVKMYLYNVKNKIKEITFFDKLGHVKRRETRFDNQITICHRTYSNILDEKIELNMCNDDTIKIVYYKKNKLRKPYEILEYQSNKLIYKTTINNQIYQVYNFKNELIQKGEYVEAYRRRDILPICTKDITFSPIPLQ